VPRTHRWAIAYYAVTKEPSRRERSVVETLGNAVCEAVRGLTCDLALINGEAVALRDNGRGDFGALMAKRGGLMR
jgi:ATP-dependent DNA ligase